MAVHECLKNEFTEDETCHNLMTWLKYRQLENNVGASVFTLAVKDDNGDDEGLVLNIEIDGTSTYFDVDGSVLIIIMTVSPA